MSQWSHLHKHQVNYDRELVIDFLHNPEALLGISKEVTSVKQVPLDDETDGDAEECWLVVEKVKGLHVEATTRVKIKRTPDGVNIHRRNPHGVELWSVWTVPGRDPKAKKDDDKTVAHEYVMAKAPWYIMPMVKSRLSQTNTKTSFQDTLDSYLTQSDAQSTQASV